MATIMFLTMGCESIVIGLGGRMAGELILEKLDNEEEKKPCKK